MFVALLLLLFSYQKVQAFPQCGSVQADDQPVLEYIGLAGVAYVDPLQNFHAIQLDICAQYIERGQRMPYTFQDGDYVVEAPEAYQGGDFQASSWIKNAAGEVVGPYLLGPAGENYTRSFDVRHGHKLETTLWSGNTLNFEIYSPDDANYLTPVNPVAVSRTSKIAAVGVAGAHETGDPSGSGIATDTIFSMAHSLYLFAPNGAFLKQGMQYYVRFVGLSGLLNGTLTGNASLFVNYAEMHSRSVHVNQVGFLPASPQKLALVSFWPGLPAQQPLLQLQQCFLLNSKGELLFVSPSNMTLKLAFDQPDSGNALFPGNHQGTDVYQCDFSAYVVDHGHELVRVCALYLGCSHPFKLTVGVYGDAISLQGRAWYFQKNGITAENYASGYNRPPALVSSATFPGIEIVQTDATLFETGNGGLSPDRTPSFDIIVAKANFSAPCKDGKGNDIDGGWQDGGDWKTRALHLEGSYLVMQAFLRYPQFFSSIDLNIPDVVTSLPDVVEEMMWNVDYFASLQLPDGSVMGGIESNSHPKYGEISPLNTQTWFCYAPDALTTLLFAASAAQASRVITEYDGARADALRAAAILAFEWGLSHASDPIDFKPPPALGVSHQDKYEARVRDTINLAALELFALTKNASYHEIFLQDTLCIPKEKNPTLLGLWQEAPPYDQVNAAILYSQLSDDDALNKTVKDYCLTYIGILADEVEVGVRKSAFGLPKIPSASLYFSTVGQAHWLAAALLSANDSSEISENHLRALGRSLDFKYGSNSQGFSFVSGLGVRQMENVLVYDRFVDNYKPSPGITVNGPFDINLLTVTPESLENETLTDPGASAPLHPSQSKFWPDMEFWIDSHWPVMDEYSVNHTMPISFVHTALYVAEMHARGLAADLSPTSAPTLAPSASPTKSPSASPSQSPSASPTLAPSNAPSASPTMTPTRSPSTTELPTVSPSASPTSAPSPSPSVSPSASPTSVPTASPTSSTTSATEITTSTDQSASPSENEAQDDDDTDFLGLDQSILGLSKQLTSILILGVAGCCFLLALLLCVCLFARSRRKNRKVSSRSSKRGSKAVSKTSSKATSKSGSKVSSKRSSMHHSSSARSSKRNSIALRRMSGKQEDGASSAHSSKRKSMKREPAEGGSHRSSVKLEKEDIVAVSDLEE